MKKNTTSPHHCFFFLKTPPLPKKSGQALSMPVLSEAEGWGGEAESPFNGVTMVRRTPPEGEVDEYRIKNFEAG